MQDWVEDILNKKQKRKRAKQINEHRDIEKYDYRTRNIYVET